MKIRNLYVHETAIRCSTLSQLTHIYLVSVYDISIYWYSEYTGWEKILKYSYSHSISCTVKSFCDFINKLIEIFQWIMKSMIPFVANAVFICWFAINCLV